jgi:hypothetical protein
MHSAAAQFDEEQNVNRWSQIDSTVKINREQASAMHPQN